MSRASGWAVAVGVLAMLGLAACEPPGPTITVTTTANGADALPGDGVCETSTGTGDCTLQAAVDEGNAQGQADLVVPAGLYRDLDLEVTGRLRINWKTPTDVVLGDVRITVATDASLNLDGVQSQGPHDPGGGQLWIPHPVQILVDGTLLLHRSTITNNFGGGPITGAGIVISASGKALVNLSVVGGGSSAITNDGVLVAHQSSLFAQAGPAVRTGEEGNTRLSASVVFLFVFTRIFSSCTGPTTSLGYVAPARGSCGPNPTNTAPPLLGYGFDPATQQVQIVHTPTLSSQVIDAIPLGVQGCSASEVDIYGNPRGVDGNGDGILGCDIGAVELQPS